MVLTMGSTLSSKQAINYHFVVVSQAWTTLIPLANDFLKKFKGIINGGGDLSDNLENLSDKLYELRNQGFNSKSEFSPENIAFKYSVSLIYFL